MDLTTDQQAAVLRSEEIPVVIGAMGCILIRADVFERIKAVLEDDLEPEQVSWLVEQNMHEYDEADALLDLYQNCR